MKLIVIDPRRSETARRAHVHLQAWPGEDSTILAGLIHIILGERLHDAAFVGDNTRGFAELSEAVSAYTPDYVAARAGVEVEDLREAARVFATAKRGAVQCATGPSFSMRSNLTFYLALCLNTLCGRWARAGERVLYPNVLLPAYIPKAQPLPPYPVFGGHRFRVHGMQENASGLPTACLPDEILMEGEGQIRALFSLGGNPASAFVDERKTAAALRSLDLLVSLDVTMSATARLAHYVVAPPMQLETPACTYVSEALKFVGPQRGFPMPWAQYTPASVPVPPGSDLLEEQTFFFRLARAMKLQLEWVNYHSLGKFAESPTERFKLDMEHEPTLDEIYDFATRSARIPLSEVKRYKHGHNFDVDVRVAPREPDCDDRLQLADPMMMAELAEIRDEDWQTARRSSAFPLLLVCRRANNYMNSIGIELPALHRNKYYNPLFIPSASAAALGLADGDVAEIRSRYETMLGIVEIDDSLRPGVVAMSHGFGARGDCSEENPRSGGSNVNRIIHVDEHDPISGIPRMSALPVAIAKHLPG
jgi:anaerobic selenocysteine-containing dehydrogenase